MAIAKELEKERLEALERQHLLHKNHCMKCPYYFNKKHPREFCNEKCKQCPINFELLEVGEVLNRTLMPRKDS